MSAYGDFFAELVRLEIELWNRLDSLQAEASAVSVAQLQALQAVASRGGDARVHDIATELQITVGAASKLVDRLERDGLASRAAHPSDRRSMIVDLTAAGEKVRVTASAAAERHLEQLMSTALSKSHAAELAADLSTLRVSLETQRLS
ncbi:MarR family winged helix-turn-helix transcriptional regulator [Agreia sp.]|uniref:MarR family winged helix-turn-helix transcriptional regulator n=1 Tax=Agreia sp. TaxID=1872416 RepID=UPI0035BC05F4